MGQTEFEVPTKGLIQPEYPLTEFRGDISLLLAELADAQRLNEGEQDSPLSSDLQQAYKAISSSATALNKACDHPDGCKPIRDGCECQPVVQPGNLVSFSAH
jgi:hypothetical protein